MNTLYELFQQQAEQLGDAVAIQAPRAADLSYRGIVAQLDDTIAALAGWGIGRGDRVMIQLVNGAEPFLAFYGVGAVAVALLLDPRAGAIEVEHFMTFVEPKAILLQQGVEGSGRAVAQQHGIRVIDLIPTPDAGAGTFTFAEPAPPSATPVLNGPDDLSYLISTSGTTALPKLIPRTQTTMLSMVLAPFQKKVRLPGEPSISHMLAYMPMHLLAGFMACASALVTGGSIVCFPNFDLARIFDWIETYQANVLTGSPAMLEQIVEVAGQHDPQSWRTIRTVQTGSAKLSDTVTDRLHRVFGVPIIHVYGMTEVGIIARTTLDLGERMPDGLAGQPIRPDAVRVVADDGSVLPANELGEVIVYSELFPGYWHNPEANVDAFLDGWFRTGDLGYLDESGNLYLTGRIKEVINSGGAKVSPQEVETVLRQHPQVSAAAVFGLKNADVGETVAAAVVGDVTERELRKFAAERLPFYKVPTRIVVVDAIPISAAGKVQRNRLPELLGLN